MALVPAKCTNCNGELQIDNSKDAAICPYCGSAFVVEKAINNYNINNPTYNVQNIYVNSGAEDFQIEAGVLVKYRGQDLDVTIPNNVKVIGEKAFAGTCVEKVTIPNSVETIRAYAFDDCNYLKELIIPESVTDIDSIGSGSKLESLKLPSKAKCDLMYLSFLWPNLKKIYISYYTYQYNLEKNNMVAYSSDNLLLFKMYIDGVEYSTINVLKKISMYRCRNNKRCIFCGSDELQKYIFMYQCDNCKKKIKISDYDSKNFSSYIN